MRLRWTLIFVTLVKYEVDITDRIKPFELQDSMKMMVLIAEREMTFIQPFCFSDPCMMINRLQPATCQRFKDQGERNSYIALYVR
jgi:hypothetical protein